MLDVNRRDIDINVILDEFWCACIMIYIRMFIHIGRQMESYCVGLKRDYLSLWVDCVTSGRSHPINDRVEQNIKRDCAINMWSTQQTISKFHRPRRIPRIMETGLCFRIT